MKDIHKKQKDENEKGPIGLIILEYFWDVHGYQSLYLSFWRTVGDSCLVSVGFRIPGVALLISAL